MKHDELTKRDIYMYNRGMLAEYIRNHPETTIEERSLLLEWIQSGNDIHSNPFDLYDQEHHCSYDYLEAIEMAESNHK